MNMKQATYSMLWLVKTHGMLLALVFGILLGLEIALL